MVEDDIVRLTEIKIKRISKFDIDKAQIKIEAIEDELDKIAFNLSNLTDFAISYFKNLKSIYGKEKRGKQRLGFLQM